MASASDIGLFSGILPFLITYTIFFFLIKRIHLLEENNDTFAAILAIAFGFYTSKFIIANPMYQNFIMDYISSVALITVGVLGLLIVLAFVGMDLSDNQGLGYVMALIVVVAFTVSGGLPAIFGENATGQAQNLLNWLISSGTVWVIAVLGLLWWTLRDSDEENESGWPELFEPLTPGGE